MTVGDFKKFVDLYCEARRETEFVLRRMNDLETADRARALYSATLDQERSALKALLVAAQQMRIE